MRIPMIPMTVALAVLASACGPGGSRDEDSDAGSDFSRAEFVTALEPGDVDAVGQAVNAFGFDLLHELSSADETTVISPLSVASMLGMALAGAGGDTAEAMAEVLHLDDRRDVRVGNLLDRLVNTEDVTVEVANGLWAGQGMRFEEPYLEFTGEVFDAALETIDLGSQQAVEEVDAWVDERTHGLITGIAEDLGLPNPAAVLVLLNAVYFLGDWTTPFDPAHTTPDGFTLTDGNVVDVPMMHMGHAEFEYTVADGYRMLRLPYGSSGRYGMEILLPDGDLDPLLETLDAEVWQNAVDRLQEADVAHLALPTFELEWGSELNGALSALGMGSALDSGADFRPMSPTNPWLDAVVHKTYIRVDEQGTEAAAVTGGMMVTSAPANPLEFVVDRPFAFTISDSDTDTILFLGTVYDPRS